MSSYTVKPGDTFTSISIQEFGTPIKAAEIAKVNPGVKQPLIPNSSIFLPPEEDELFDPTPPLWDGPISLEVEGEKFEHFEEISFEKNMDSVSTFTLSMNHRNNRAFRKAFVPLEIKECVLKVSNIPVITGYMVHVKPNSASSKVVVEGYGKPGILGDSVLPDGARETVFRGKKIDYIAKSLSSHWGIGVKIKSSLPITPPSVLGQPFRWSKIKVDTKVLDFISDLCEDRGFVITDDEKGNLVLDKTEVPLPIPLASLERGKSPFLGASLNTDPQNFFSHITAYRSGFSGSKSTSKNPFFSNVLRPFGWKVKRSESRDITLAAKTKLGRMVAQVLDLQVDVLGWGTKSGLLWTKGDQIEVQDPKLMIYKPYLFQIRGFKCSQVAGQEKRTSLSLMIPGSFAGELPPVLPFG